MSETPTPTEADDADALVRPAAASYTDRAQGYAVEVLRTGEGARLLMGTDALHCGFWHHPINKHPRETRMDGVPFAQPLNARQRPVLIFATLDEAEVAADYFNAIWGKRSDQRETWREDVTPGEYVGLARPVNGAPSHQLSDHGFQAITPAGSLFA